MTDELRDPSLYLSYFNQQAEKDLWTSYQVLEDFIADDDDGFNDHVIDLDASHVKTPATVYGFPDDIAFSCSVSSRVPKTEKRHLYGITITIQGMHVPKQFHDKVREYPVVQDIERAFKTLFSVRGSRQKSAAPLHVGKIFNVYDPTIRGHRKLTVSEAADHFKSVDFRFNHEFGSTNGQFHIQGLIEAVTTPNIGLCLHVDGACFQNCLGPVLPRVLDSNGEQVLSDPSTIYVHVTRVHDGRASAEEYICKDFTEQQAVFLDSLKYQYRPFEKCGAPRARGVENSASSSSSEPPKKTPRYSKSFVFSS